MYLLHIEVQLWMVQGWCGGSGPSGPSLFLLLVPRLTSWFEAFFSRGLPVQDGSGVPVLSSVGIGTHCPLSPTIHT